LIAICRNLPNPYLLFSSSDEVKQLAEVVRDKLRDLIGMEKSVEVYNSVRKSLKEKRESRKQSEKIIAAVDPARHAKRKLRIAAKHQEHNENCEVGEVVLYQAVGKGKGVVV
jgi:methyl coenzyme M reductase gamma subunit